MAQIDPDTQAAETHSHRRRRDGRAGRRFYPRRPSPARSKSGSRGLDNPVRYPARSGPFTSNATSFCFCRTDNRGGRPGGGILVEREHRVHRPVDENPYRSVDAGGTCRRGIVPHADRYLYLSKDRTKSTVRQIEASLRTVHSGCPMSIPDSARKRIPDFGDSTSRREPGTRVTIHDSNARPPSRPTRTLGPPDSDVALNTDDLATADTDRAPAASRTVRPVMVEIFGSDQHFEEIGARRIIKTGFR